MTTRVLTGITTTGTPHLGNYAGAIRPAIELSRQSDVDAFFFMADYHALIKCEDPERVARSRLEIAATWIAAGLDPEKVTFYRQSDIPETTELCWMLSCVTPKGLMNRAHAYKASVDQNTEKGEDPDDGVTMGLFSYPVLMAADILIFNANKVPVGRDQIQHLEMARDIAQRFNHLYGKGEAFFVLPEAQVDDEVATLPGLDGRKMSKSYDNTIPLFEGGSQALRNAIMRIVTDSREPGVSKDPDSSHVFALYRAFATQDQASAFRRSLEEGLGWGEAKTQLYELLESIIGPMREKYNQLMADPSKIESILQAGALKARKQSGDLMTRLREAVGLRAPVSSAGDGKKDKAKSRSARFVSFRENGKFHFRLLSAQGEELLLSEGFDQPKDAGQAMAALKQQGPQALALLQDGVWQLAWQGQTFCHLSDAQLKTVAEVVHQLNRDAE
ncbi:MAG: tryptophan--tRNA ligase [Pusillimonas sp.]|nr:tryptophan--tRNA ligase [Pusillimonas sp.]|tara:strand:- start:83630 stop:84964 length:1335 start_codon:yes stop_codon:yes gene_type:complete